MVYGETPSKRGTFFRLHVNERVRILLVEVYFKSRGICHFHHKKAQNYGLTDAFCGCGKVENTFWFCELFIFLIQCLYSS